jgi:hypothetical protein
MRERKREREREKDVLYSIPSHIKELIVIKAV